MPSPNKPIFIVGVGRSGSSALHRLLSRHPRVAWLPMICNRFPNRPKIAGRLMRFRDTPLAPLLRGPMTPAEGYRFWDHHCPGFSTPFRDLRADDVTRTQRARLTDAFVKIPSRRRDRLLLKLTGWPRIGFLSEIFPDAKFLHLVRDGRAVASSLLLVDWWWGWRGPHNWRFGELDDAHREELDRHDGSFVALAGIEWKLVLDAVRLARASLDPADFLEIRYEDLCRDPIETLREAVSFLELPWTPGFEARVRRTSLSSRNERWRERLTAAQQRTLEQVIGGHLRTYGYE